MPRDAGLMRVAGSGRRCHGGTNRGHSQFGPVPHMGGKGSVLVLYRKQNSGAAPRVAPPAVLLSPQLAPHRAPKRAVCACVLRAAASAPNQPELDYRRRSREPSRPLNTPSDQATTAGRPLAHYVPGAAVTTAVVFRNRRPLRGALAPRPETRPHSEFGSVLFFGRDMKFVVAWTM